VVLPEGIEMLYNSMDSMQLGGHTRLIRNAETAIPGAIPHPGHVVRQGSEHIDHSPHLAIALSLVAGYLIMHLLTFLPPLLLSSNDQSPIPLSSIPSSPTFEQVSSGSSPFAPTGLSNTTIGLCIHALADGIALGSSAVSDNLALEGIVFLAIMLHKVSILYIQI
jgi:zinc transporter 9